MAHEQAHLLTAVRGVVAGDVEDREDLVLVVLGLRSLTDVDNVLQSQRMEVEELSERARGRIPGMGLKPVRMLRISSIPLLKSLLSI